MDVRLKDLDTKLGETPPRGVLDGELIDQKYPIFFDKLE
jgi:hypothetical protein